MNLLRRLSAVIAVVVTGLCSGFAAPSAQASLAPSADGLVATNDEVTLSAGWTARVAVLANDRLNGKHVEVRVTGIPVPDLDGVVVGLNRARKLVVKTFPTTDEGKYIVAYRLIGPEALTDRAKVTITVVSAT